jgi:phage terminase large subunit
MSVAPVRLAPADVADRLFGVDMWATPRAILDAVFRPQSRVAVKACHASSKTHTAAVAIALTLYEGGDVLTTAPTWQQVKSVLWGELHRLLAGSVIPLSEWGSVNQTEIVMPDGSRALGLSTNEGVNFQGWHARDDSFLLVIFDEAPGVRADIYESVEGISAGGDVRILLIGNPVTASGPFYDIFAADAPGWSRFTIDAFDTPNLSGLTLEGLLGLGDEDLEVCARPYMVTRRWVRDRYYDWGTDHPAWDARVRGQFPRLGTDALIALAWVEDANRRARRNTPGTGLVAGVDVAGPGEDETVVAVRRGDDILAVRPWSIPDARDEVLRYLQSLVPLGLQQVNVDSVGMGHFFHLDMVAGLEPSGVAVQGINVGLPSEVKDSLGNAVYANLKAEYFWELRRRFMEGQIRASGVFDQTTLSQLVGILYQQPRGIVTIEKKEDARKRGVSSPDRAEALMLTCAPPSRHAAFASQFGTVHTLPSVSPRVGSALAGRGRR